MGDSMRQIYSDSYSLRFLMGVCVQEKKLRTLKASKRLFGECVFLVHIKSRLSFSVGFSMLSMGSARQKAK